MFNITAWLDAYLMSIFQKSILFEMLLRNLFLTLNYMSSVVVTANLLNKMFRC